MEAQVVKILDQNTANKIAAGEVVEKPASVVKELVENSLDAGATSIEVSIFEGGIEYIRVVDNGCGMTRENAELAVLRHATSKLRNADDLLTLGTLGFRGEAVPSIAAVSKFTLITRPEQEEMATCIRLDGGLDMTVSEIGGSAGTTILVENLFFNVPARRKFLKTPLTEGRYIREVMEKLALSRPDVSFVLKNNDKEVMHTPGNSMLRYTIRSIYGKAVGDELLEVNFNDPKVSITGFISKPTLLKGTRQWQTIFVNGRVVGNKMLSKAIDHAYQSQIPKNGFPYTVLNITIDTHDIDINVHPQKSEIKFSDDSLMYKAMFKALTDALTNPMKGEAKPVTLLPDSELNIFQKPVDLEQVRKQREAVEALQAKREAETKSDKPAGENFRQLFRSDAGAIFRNPEEEDVAPKTSVKTTPVTPVKSVVEPTFVPAEPEPEQQSIWKPFEDFSSKATKPYAEVEETKQGVAEAITAGSSFKNSVGYSNAAPVSNNMIQSAPVAPQTINFTNTNAQTATVWPIGQVDKTFIIAQSEDTLYLVDQHAAHERILFDKLMATHTDIPSQPMLIPMYINMADEEIELIESNQDALQSAGVDASRAGDNVLRISSLPTDLDTSDAEEFLVEIVKNLREMRSVDGSVLRQEILHTTACKAAIKAGQILNMQQMRQLLVDLFNTEHPFTCPHGRPCMIEFDSDKLYNLFKRNGF